MKKQNIYFIFLILLLITIVSCKKNEITPASNQYGQLKLIFTHEVNGYPLVKDSMIYMNEAGNFYEVNELRYFLSDITLHNSNGSDFIIQKEKDIYYVDNDIATTLMWQVPDNIPVGQYESISFTFGIPSYKNISYMFVNPPEVNMLWPEMLGGGYHYMMLNGKWLDTLGQIENINTHLGIGCVISGNNLFYADNSFNVNLNSSFSIGKDATTEIEVVMNIDSWYKTPYTYDHNVYGQNIMNNQEAMLKIADNGFDVFSVGEVK